jgi:hypothetical protein
MAASQAVGGLTTILVVGVVGKWQGNFHRTRNHEPGGWPFQVTARLSFRDSVPLLFFQDHPSREKLWCGHGSEPVGLEMAREDRDGRPGSARTRSLRAICLNLWPNVDPQPRKLRVGFVKFGRLGKMVGRSAAPTPNHLARVAPYWSTEVEGIQRPLVPTSSGPPSARVGKVP